MLGLSLAAPLKNGLSRIFSSRETTDTATVGIDTDKVSVEDVLVVMGGGVVGVPVDGKVPGGGLSVISSGISRIKEVIKLGIFLDEDSSVLAT
jgi:hypothetical protein